jgi:diguanylate cyclase (GGDEF)-like protein
MDLAELKIFKSKTSIFIISLLLIFAIGWLDYITGTEITLGEFYFLPVAFATWYIGPRYGWIVSLLCVLASYFADRLGGIKYSNFIIPIYDGLVGFAIYGFFVFLLARLKKDLEMQKQLAMEDFLTKASNGRAFYNYANMEIARLKRYGTPLTIVYLDMDDFKKVNDSKGHKAGDELLITLINSIRKNIRATDVVGRLGGDEFAVLLPDMNAAAAAPFVKFIRETLDTELRKHGWSVTFSAGVVTYTKPPKSVDEMITLADNVMYSVKKSGKNSVKYISCE